MPVMAVKLKAHHREICITSAICIVVAFIPTRHNAQRTWIAIQPIKYLELIDLCCGKMQCMTFWQFMGKQSNYGCYYAANT